MNKNVTNKPKKAREKNRLLRLADVRPSASLKPLTRRELLERSVLQTLRNVYRNVKIIRVNRDGCLIECDYYIKRGTKYKKIYSGLMRSSIPKKILMKLGAQKPDINYAKLMAEFDKLKSDFNALIKKLQG